jgi:hypothetical protein
MVHDFAAPARRCGGRSGEENVKNARFSGGSRVRARALAATQSADGGGPGKQIQDNPKAATSQLTKAEG